AKLRQELESFARQVGIVAIGVADAATLGSRPADLLPGVRSIVAVAVSYHIHAPLVPATPLQAKIARYALGRDYHLVVGSKLRRLAEFVTARAGSGIAWRACVDNHPLPEKHIAQQAGLGWIGKNTLLYVPGFGSRVVL